MDYHFEALGDERFQKLCQALLVAEFPNVTCFPVGMPDGGRDAALSAPGGKDVIIFQVKYSRDPSTKDARETVLGAIRTEAEKVRRLVGRGAVQYVLITNVTGTSHLDTGSMDRAKHLLDQELGGINATVWWRDDLVARLNHSSHVKWNFIELLKGGDILEKLVSTESKSEESARKAIDSYISLEYVRDSQLKFKQIDLERGILSLFSDVPAQIERSTSAAQSQREVSVRAELSEYGIEVQHEYDAELKRRMTSVGAMQLLANEKFSESRNLVLLEGAPGQGKSTVTQYLCQIHRLILLGYEDDLKQVEKDLVPEAVRVPFRVDLRDYAAWLSGRNPFSENYSEQLPLGTSPVLEKFLAAQVSRATGVDFTVENLRWISSKSRLLIVLDGFDEVADVGIRARIITEAGEAAIRLERASRSVQIVVTSRPTAFVNSPGFPRGTWSHMDLLPLARSHVNSHAKRWLAAKGFDPRERRVAMRALEDAMVHTHVRDLARNPMQLSILLALMNVQGVSLPNKRTSLYDKYMDIFFNRETEKSSVVRDNRDLILHLHGFVAWKLQLDAENSGAGNISADALKSLVRGYLERHGHKETLLDELLTGVTERVVALVSRVEGTYEFEVQPLREYFAARHIYDTAPYVVASLDQGGTKPDRFRALSRNFFWRNVARFYAGCYTTGELASIVEGLTELGDDPRLSETIHPVRFGFDLLTDYVFANKPKLAERVLDPLVDRSKLMLFAVIAKSPLAPKGYPLSEGPARERLLHLLSDEIEASKLESHRAKLLSLYATNSTMEERRQLISNESRRTSGPVSASTLSILGAIEFESAEYLSSVVVDSERHFVRSLFSNDRLDAVDMRPGALATMQSVIAWDPYSLMQHYEALPRSAEALRFIRVASVFANYRLHAPWEDLGEESFGSVTGPYFAREEMRAEYLSRTDLLPRVDESGFDWSEFEAVLAELELVLFGELSVYLHTLMRLVDVGLQSYGQCLAIEKFAYSLSMHLGESELPLKLIVDPTVHLLERCLIARSNHDVEAWRELINRVVAVSRGEGDSLLDLVAVMAHAPLEEIVGSASELSLALGKLSGRDYHSLYVLLEDRHIDDDELGLDVLVQSLPEMSPRLGYALKPRLGAEKYDLVWNGVLKDIHCSDRNVASDLVSHGIHKAQEDESLWQSVFNAARRHLPITGHYGFVHDDVILNSSVPVDLARSIIKEPFDYPPLIVALCVARLDALLGQDSAPVSVKAVEQCWPE